MIEIWKDAFLQLRDMKRVKISQIFFEPIKFYLISYCCRGGRGIIFSDNFTKKEDLA